MRNLTHELYDSQAQNKPHLALVSGFQKKEKKLFSLLKVIDQVIPFFKRNQAKISTSKLFDMSSKTI